MHIYRTLYKYRYLSVFCLNMLVFYGKTKAVVLKALQYDTKIPNHLSLEYRF